MDMTRYHDFVYNTDENGSDMDGRMTQILEATANFKRVLRKIPSTIKVAGNTIENYLYLPEGIPCEVSYKGILIPIVPATRQSLALLGHDFALVYVDPVRHNR